ncbi:glutamate--tRNA ligase [Rhizosphaericola mali]|uniref:Glutamate--tRNA ligase n=1 Tax=Rhizosphaericola mali TaxID=2545455 RepID=A0A5P2G4X5_9BACT|nr:glutamate--tRNA ligase [Rhizosphaericola mali]QES90575.1 glutamate--tRNA ligase [Rhizosphaericola mali]
MEKKVRTRFAPSPTGGLHLGGVRTALYNYLFAKHFGGEFILRIEDTDQTRFVPGAEEYITETLKWSGINPDESPANPGQYAPYRQSERKPMYKEYAEKLITEGHAYYAFDTPEELTAMRENFKSESNPSPKYDFTLRDKMQNSLSLTEEETKAKIEAGIPYVVRIKMEANEKITFTDLIRGEVSFNTSDVDDKVLLKADGMPTYHLAVVVDDYLMKITHAFRGEEWLPSSPIHIKLWEYLFGIENMPEWAHLPLIMKPDGKGKLSKRDGAKLGFPVFAMNWTDPRDNEFTEGFRERGFVPEAFVNMLALIGWNDGTEQELFSLKELIEKFDITRVHKGGAKFNYTKALWFNKEWLKQIPGVDLVPAVKPLLLADGVTEKQIDADIILAGVIDLVKEKCTLLPDFVKQADFFFRRPAELDTASAIKKWTLEDAKFYKEQLIPVYENCANWTAQNLEELFMETTQKAGIEKPGNLMLPLRIMWVGGKFGPHVFDVAALIGKKEALERMNIGLKAIEKAFEEKA